MTKIVCMDLYEEINILPKGHSGKVSLYTNERGQWNQIFPVQAAADFPGLRLYVYYCCAPLNMTADHYRRGKSV